MNYEQLPNPYQGDPYQQYGTHERVTGPSPDTMRDADLERSMQNYGLGPEAGSPASPGSSPSEAEPLRGRAREKTLEVSQDDSVYSAILFLPAISRLKEGRETNRNARLALMLVVLNAILQIGVVNVISIYDFTLRRAETQQILNPYEVPDYGDHALSEVDKESSKLRGEGEDEVRSSVYLPQERNELEAVRSINPLCRKVNGDLSCQPGSVQFVYEWTNLDTNGDGVWSAEEASADQANLKEKLGVSPPTIFNNIISGLRASRDFEESRGKNRTLYLTSDVDYERAIPKAYFNYWAGDAMMCTFFDSSSCEAAAKDGVFEEALRPGRMSADAKGIRDLDSAIQYCYRMLSPGGGCEVALPTDFKRNREQRWGRCGKRTLVEGGKYTSPYDPDQSVHILRASYSSLSAYDRATSRLFLFFLALLIMLWLLALMDEWREILKFAEFLVVFPGIAPGTQGGEIIAKGDDGPSYRITGLSRKHRAVLVVVFITRLAVIITLTRFGTKFQLVQTNYLDLVINSLALTFILTIDSMLFAMVEKDVADEVRGAKPLRFRTRLPTEGFLGYCLKKECWGLFLLPILSVCIVLYVNSRDKEPILKALMCACVQEGETCLDSMVYKGAWWSSYWSRVLPAAMHQIEALRIAGNVS
jgi:hypothetical protein